MGLKPTQYRCASESLLRRFRKEGELPRIHPLIDLCNAASLAYALPVAALDAGKVAWPLQVRFADGSESYESFERRDRAPGSRRSELRRRARPGACAALDAPAKRLVGDPRVDAAVLVVMEAVHPSPSRRGRARVGARWRNRILLDRDVVQGHLSRQSPVFSVA